MVGTIEGGISQTPPLAGALMPPPPPSQQRSRSLPPTGHLSSTSKSIPDRTPIRPHLASDNEDSSLTTARGSPFRPQSIATVSAVRRQEQKMPPPNRTRLQAEEEMPKVRKASINSASQQGTGAKKWSAPFHVSVATGRMHSKVTAPSAPIEIFAHELDKDSASDDVSDCTPRALSESDTLPAFSDVLSSAASVKKHFTNVAPLMMTDGSKPVRCVALSPNNSYIALCGEMLDIYAIDHIDEDTTALSTTALQGSSCRLLAECVSACFNTNDHFLACITGEAKNSRVQVFKIKAARSETAQGECHVKGFLGFRLSQHCTSCQFSPVYFGILLVSLEAPAAIELWAIETKSLLYRFTCTQCTKYSCGKFIADALDLPRYNMRSSNKLSGEHDSKVECTSFNHGELVAFGGADKRISVWAYMSGRRRLERRRAFDSDVLSIDVNRSIVAVGVTERKVILWCLVQNAILRSIPIAGAAKSLAFFSQTQLVTGGATCMSLLNLETGKVARDWWFDGAVVRQVCTSSTFIACCFPAGPPFLTTPHSLKEHRIPLSDRSSLPCVTISADSALCAVADNKRVVLWRAMDQVGQIACDNVVALSFHPHGGKSGHLRKAAARHIDHKIHKNHHHMDSKAHGLLLSAVTTEGVRTWDSGNCTAAAADNAALQSLLQEEERGLLCVLGGQTNGKEWVAAGGRHLFVWMLNQKPECITFPCGDDVLSITYSPAELERCSIIATACRYHVRLFDFDSREVLYRMSGEYQHVVLNGSMCASVDSKQKLQVWEFDSENFQLQMQWQKQLHSAVTGINWDHKLCVLYKQYIGVHTEDKETGVTFDGTVLAIGGRLRTQEGPRFVCGVRMGELWRMDLEDAVLSEHLVHLHAFLHNERTEDINLQLNLIAHQHISDNEQTLLHNIASLGWLRALETLVSFGISPFEIDASSQNAFDVVNNNSVHDVLLQTMVTHQYLVPKSLNLLTLTHTVAWLIREGTVTRLAKFLDEALLQSSDDCTWLPANARCKPGRTVLPLRVARSRTPQLTPSVVDMVAPQFPVDAKTCPVEIKVLHLVGCLDEDMGILESLLQPTASDDIFGSVAIQAFVKLQWARCRFRYVYDSLAYVIYLITFFCVTVIFRSKNSMYGSRIILILISLLLLLFCSLKREILIFQHGAQEHGTVGGAWKYVSSWWNILDIIRLSTNFYVLVYELFRISEDGLADTYTVSLAALLAWWKVLFFLRGIEMTGALVRELGEVARDGTVLGFLVLIIVMWMASTHAFYTLMEEGGDYPLLFANENAMAFSWDRFVHAFILVYKVIFLGDTDIGKHTPPIPDLVHLLSTLLSSVVMMNLLIALISDVDARVKANYERAKYRELVDLINEFEPSAKKYPTAYVVFKKLVKYYPKLDSLLPKNMHPPDRANEIQRGFIVVGIPVLASQDADESPAFTRLEEQISKHCNRIEAMIRVLTEQQRNASAMRVTTARGTPSRSTGIGLAP
eukprot:GEMP01001434.1.p1 GENE.GEMP01001434.1~~GEMP01001434.1.p1  ORF type:complete len:1480 (+),score=270.73 GEMP01001434.1:164-4603(+)